MEDWQQRVYTEYTELLQKINALYNFIYKDEKFQRLDAVDKALMGEQIKAMKDYTSVLERRIARF